jgi:hypothetical protein
VILASQDPMTVPRELMPMLDMVGVFHHEAEPWNRYLGRELRPFRYARTRLTARLQKGQMLFWAREWLVLDPTLGELSAAPLVLEVRPRASQHGGETRKAVR